MLQKTAFCKFKQSCYTQENVAIHNQHRTCPHSQRLYDALDKLLMKIIEKLLPKKHFVFLLFVCNSHMLLLAQIFYKLQSIPFSGKSTAITWVDGARYK